MADEPRDWQQVRVDAIKALITAATDFGHDDIVSGSAATLTDAVLAVVDEEAVTRMAHQFVEESRFRALQVRDGKIELEMQAAREISAMWVGAARAMLKDAPNYSETEMTFNDGVLPERYAFTVQRVGKLTPHQARRQAEARADRLASAAKCVDDNERFQIEEARHAVARWDALNSLDIYGTERTLADHVRNLVELLDQITPKEDPNG